MINDKKVLAIVTARAGSKGLYGKNYLDFCGKPLVSWSLQAAFYSKYIDAVVVSSNCEGVRKAVFSSLTNSTCPYKAYWVNEPDSHPFILCKDKEGEPLIKYDNPNNIPCYWINRIDEHATHSSKNEQALIYCYKKMLYSYAEKFDILVNLQPTSPVRKKKLIDDVLYDMLNGGYDSAFTVSEHTPFFVQTKDKSIVKWFYNPNNRPMRQDISDSEMFLHDDGCLYAVDSNVLLETECRIGKNPLVYKNDPASSHQIDTKLDFLVLETLKKELNETGEYI